MGSKRLKCVMTVLSLYVGIEVRVTTFDTSRTISDSKQSVAASLGKLPDSAIQSVVSRACHRHSLDVSDVSIRLSISLGLADFLYKINLKICPI